MATEGSRWCEVVVHQEDLEDPYPVEVNVCSPRDAIKGLKNWLLLADERTPNTKFTLHIGDESVWEKADEGAFADEVWDELWSTMTESQLLPCKFTDIRG